MSEFILKTIPISSRQKDIKSKNEFVQDNRSATFEKAHYNNEPIRNINHIIDFTKKGNNER